MNKLTAIASIGTLALLGACASNTPAPPTTTPDGLELVSSDKHSAVYIKPEAELEIYEKFGIVPCKVAFRKNWQRDYNSAHRSTCLLYTSPSPRDRQKSRMPSSA